MNVDPQSPPAAAFLWIVAEDTQRTLFLCRPPGLLTPWMWSFPGGGIERGETDLQAAYRELFEETGFSGPLRVDYAIDCPQFRAVTFCATCETEWIPKLNHEHISWSWVDAKNPLALERVHPGVIEVWTVLKDEGLRHGDL